MCGYLYKGKKNLFIIGYRGRMCNKSDLLNSLTLIFIFISNILFTLSIFYSNMISSSKSTCTSSYFLFSIYILKISEVNKDLSISSLSFVE